MMRANEFTLKDVGPNLVGTLQLYVPKPNTEITEILKPAGAHIFWTSTATKNPNGTYTSAWADWCAGNMPQWLHKKGELFRVTSGVKILRINTDKDALAVGAHYGYQPNFKDKFSLDSIKWITKFPWDKIQNDYDGIHHEPSGSRTMNWLMSSWDVESTAWFNRKYLQDAGRTKIRPEEFEI